MTDLGIVTGWLLDAEQRDRLLAHFPPLFARIVAHHVTLRHGTDDATPLPGATAGEVVGETDDGIGVQALVVAIEGTTLRSDRGHFHITWSLGEGRAARESNDVIAEHGWRAIDEPIPIRLIPARFR